MRLKSLVLGQVEDSELTMARADERRIGKMETSWRSSSGGARGLTWEGADARRESPQLLLAKILSKSNPPDHPGGQDPKGRQGDPPEPGGLGGQAAGGEGRVSPGWPKAPLTVTVSKPITPRMLPLP